MNARTPQFTPQEMADLSALMNAISHNPKTRHMAARLVAQVSPETARVAFQDVIQDEKMAAFFKKVEERELQGQIARATEAREAQKRSVVSKRGLSAEAVKELEKIQTQYGFTDWEGRIYTQRATHPPTQVLNLLQRSAAALLTFPPSQGKTERCWGSRTTFKTRANTQTTTPIS